MDLYLMEKNICKRFERSRENKYFWSKADVRVLLNLVYLMSKSN